MIDHVSIPVADLAAAGDFYNTVLAPFGMTRLAIRKRTIGYGKRYPEFWLNLREDHVRLDNPGLHVALRCRSPEIVDAFHAAALAAGGVSDGAPGTRQGEMTAYYGAFVRDLDGNRIEAVTFPATD